MISFEREYNKIRVRLSGDRSYITANNIDEACEALRHYYGENQGHNSEKCPICKYIAEKNRKEAKGG